MPSKTPTAPSNDAIATKADESILAELSLILKSPQFTGTSRSKRFLEYIVKETLAGRGDALKGYTIALDVFDKSTNFDSSQNTVVRVQATQVRRRLKLYYADKTAHTGVHISLPKGRYKPIFLTHTSNTLSGRFIQKNETSNFDNPTLFIQPLKNYSEEHKYQSFIDSVTTELIHKLINLNAFTVIQSRLEDLEDNIENTPPNSTGTQDIALHSGDAGYIISGGLRRHDFQVRVTILLSAKMDSTYIKTKAFDESFTAQTIFDAPEILAKQIVDFIDAK